MNDIHLLFLKKNLRTHDHAALYHAMKSGPTIAVYCFEPSIMGESDFSHFHTSAIVQSLEHLQSSLKKLHIPLLIFEGETVDTLSRIQHALRRHTIISIHSQEETGNLATYRRDIEIAKWCTSRGVQWKEYLNNGVIRRLSSRDNWSKKWNERTMNKKVPNPSPQKTLEIPSTLLRSSQGVLTQYSQSTKWLQSHWAQHTNEAMVQKNLTHFLNHRSTSYSYHISKPHESSRSCSRLSVGLAYGNISIRTIYQASLKKIEEIKMHPGSHPSHVRHIRNFMSRLHWHDHFIQKLEDQPDIETTNMQSEFDSIRTRINTEWLGKFEAGMTGIPYIDACMRCLRQTGWINFRARACLVSFMCNTCMQPWQPVSKILARLFTDYEPGIHYPQHQMQAGTTGMNTFRIYNPTKQILEHDQQGVFIKKWCPELSQLPLEAMAEPWITSPSMSGIGSFSVGKDYTFPIVNIQEANREARKILWGMKRSVRGSQQHKNIIKKHASRKQTHTGVTHSPQLQLFDETRISP